MYKNKQESGISYLVQQDEKVKILMSPTLPPPYFLSPFFKTFVTHPPKINELDTVVTPTPVLRPWQPPKIWNVHPDSNGPSCFRKYMMLIKVFENFTGLAEIFWMSTFNSVGYQWKIIHNGWYIHLRSNLLNWYYTPVTLWLIGKTDGIQFGNQE